MLEREVSMSHSCTVSVTHCRTLFCRTIHMGLCQFFFLPSLQIAFNCLFSISNDAPNHSSTSFFFFFLWVCVDLDGVFICFDSKSKQTFFKTELLLVRGMSSRWWRTVRWRWWRTELELSTDHFIPLWHKCIPVMSVSSMGTKCSSSYSFLPLHTFQQGFFYFFLEGKGKVTTVFLMKL